MNSHIFYALFLLLLEGVCGQELFPTKISFEESTRTYFGDDNNGTAAAFADYNGDGSPDLFAITKDGHAIEVYSKSESGTRWKVPSDGVAVQWLNASIIGVTPADFTGDETADLLVLVVPEGGTDIVAYVHIGDDDLNFGDGILVSKDLHNQPIVADYNFDMVADVFGAKKDGSLQFWVYQSDKFISKPVANPKKSPLNYAFVSLDKDLVPGLFVESQTDAGSTYDFYQVRKGDTDATEVTWQLEESRSHDLPSKGPIGLSTFVDINADGSIDQVVPICDNAECTHSGVKYYSFEISEWVDILTPEDLGDWHFVPPSDAPTPGEIPAGLKLREGDVNLDSYTDFVCIMREGSNQTNEVVLLLNNNKGRSLTLDTSIPRGQGGPAFVASLVDISNTALLDIIINIRYDNGTNKFHLLTSPFSPDANFIKVEVVMRTCGSSKCPTQSHVANQPGPVIQYATTTPSGERQYLIAVLLSQSSYLSLQLPYVIMGLGQNPNFVDNVTVGIPNTCCGLGAQRTKSWLSLIPNSQLVVYPAVLDEPPKWESNLIVHPSQSVLLTGVVLIGTCAFIALIAGVLHLLERREDDKQKRQEAHKFHFDAM